MKYYEYALSHVKEESEIIIMHQNQDKILRESLYTYLHNLQDSSYLVNHVSEEEFSIMKEQINQKGYLSERNRPFDFSYHREYYLLFKYQKSKKTYVNDYNSFKTTGTYLLEENHLTYYEALIPFPNQGIFYTIEPDFKIYTTESFQDILNHYQKTDTFFLETEELKRVKKNKFNK